MCYRVVNDGDPKGRKFQAAQENLGLRRFLQSTPFDEIQEAKTQNMCITWGLTRVRYQDTQRQDTIVLVHVLPEDPFSTTDPHIGSNTRRAVD